VQDNAVEAVEVGAAAEASVRLVTSFQIYSYAISTLVRGMQYCKKYLQQLLSLVIQ
jgi:hypothetical protein